MTTSMKSCQTLCCTCQTMLNHVQNVDVETDTSRIWRDRDKSTKMNYEGPQNQVRLITRPVIWFRQIMMWLSHHRLHILGAEELYQGNKKISFWHKKH